MTKLHYERRGRGTPLLLVHGFLGGIPEWKSLTDALAPSFDVVAVDLPGFCGSADVPAPASVAGYGDLLAQLLAELKISRCIVFGHSFGAMIAQQFALDHGALVERLVLYGAAPRGQLPGRFETFDATIDRLRRTGIAQGSEPIIASWFVAGRAHPAFAMYREMAALARTDTAVATLRAIAAWKVTDRLGEITVPTLVIGGDRDRSTEPAEQITIWRGVKQGQLCILPNCAHAAHLEQPEVFLRLLCRFLSET